MNSFIENPEKIYAAAAKLHIDSLALKNQLLDSTQVRQSRLELKKEGPNADQSFDMQ